MSRCGVGAVALALLLGSVCVGSRQAFADAREILYVCYSKEADGGSVDNHIAKACAASVAKLKACGFAVKEMESPEIADVKKYIKEREASHEIFSMISGHGGNLDEDPENREKRCSQEDFYVDPRGKKIKGKDLLEAYSRPGDVPVNVWMDTCKAGACRNLHLKSFSLGMSCLNYQVGAMDAPVETEIIDLLCSSRGDRKLWDSVDKNHDGYVSGDELNSHLKTKHGEENLHKELERRGSTIAEVEEGRAECVSHGGVFSDVTKIDEEGIVCVVSWTPKGFRPDQVIGPLTPLQDFYHQISSVTRPELPVNKYFGDVRKSSYYPNRLDQQDCNRWESVHWETLKVEATATTPEAKAEATAQKQHVVYYRATCTLDKSFAAVKGSESSRRQFPDFQEKFRIWGGEAVAEPAAEDSARDHSRSR